MNINEVKQIIATADVCGHVPLIKGVHGIGKSESAEQYAKENNMHYEPLILSLMDTGDMLGLPVTKKVGGVEATIWAAPNWYVNIVNAAWPQLLRVSKLHFNDKDLGCYVLNNKKDRESSEISRGELNELYCEYYNLAVDSFHILRQDNVSYTDSRRSVLFLDEFNRAPSDILNASLQLILEHRLHCHVLPRINGQETLVVAAVNPADGNYTVQELDPALLDRFVDCEAEPDFESWLSWAKENNVNSVVTDFLTENPSKFHFTPADGSKGASPRSWTRLATYIDRVKDTPEDIMSYYIKGTVGSSLAASFIMFYNNYSTAFTLKDLVKVINKTIPKNLEETNCEQAGKIVSKLIKDVEAVRKMDFADSLISTYLIEEDKETEGLPALIFCYGLPLENLAATLKRLQTDDVKAYAKLAQLDKKYNKKALFLRLVKNLKD